MPETRDPPPTDEGWYALHDFRTIDWDAWRDTPERDRDRILSEAVEYLDSALAVSDAEEGATAIYSVLGHKADLLVLHLRPSTAHIGSLERGFEQTEFAGYTERTTSFVSVTEASGYSERAREYFEGELDENSGLANYIKTRLHPTIPDVTHVCFYPMNKRRQPGQNWYDLPFDERAEFMEAHGDIGRNYGGRVVQMITGAIAFDDWEWGVTLWGDDLVDMKDLLYEMRFDPSTSQFAEFGPFYIGRRIDASDLPALLAGEAVPADETDAKPTSAEKTTAHGTSVDSRPVHPADATEDGKPDSTAATSTETAQQEKSTQGENTTEEPPAASDSESGPPSTASDDTTWVEEDQIATRLKRVGIFPGEEFETDGYALVLHSSTDATEVAEEVDGLRGNFEHYDSHVLTTVRAESGRTFIVSIWDAERAANTAHGFLQDLPGVSESYGGPVEAGNGEQHPDATAAEHDRHAAGDGHAAGGGHTAEDGHTAEESADIREELAELDVYAGQPHGEDIYALVLYSQADTETLESEVSDLSNGFDRYDTHEGTTVYEDPHSDTSAVVSLWETADAADTASGYLTDLPGVVGWAAEGDGFGTMGMFYTVKPEYREDFVGTFEDVGGLLAEMDGHRETALLVNTDDENDMFIASQWDSRDDALSFFRSDAFAETLEYGREVLADRPRHVFLA